MLGGRDAALVRGRSRARQPGMFPFVWVGAAFAAGFLAASMVAFALLARVLRVPEGDEGSLVAGLLAGFRDWASDRAAGASRPVSAAGQPPSETTRVDSGGSAGTGRHPRSEPSGPTVGAVTPDVASSPSAYAIVARVTGHVDAPRSSSS